MSKIHIVAELERHGIAYEYAGENELKTLCPFHEDSSPSVFINQEKQNFNCQACKAKGDFLKFLSKRLGVDRNVLLEDFKERYNLDDFIPIDPQLIEQYHEALISDSGAHLRRELYLRALNDSDIREARLGMHKNRIIIPVPAEDGAYANLRSYLPGAPAGEKFKNQKGRAKLRPYPWSQTKYNKILICGGELKAKAAGKHVNPKGFGAWSMTGGEGSWDIRLNYLLRGKEVWVCLDVDEHGKSAALDICRKISKVALGVHLVTLPLDPSKFPKGDLNDYLMQPDANLAELLAASPSWKEALEETIKKKERIDVKVSRAPILQPDQPVRCVGRVVATGDSIFDVPVKCRINCSRNEKVCNFCSIFIDDETKVYELPKDSPLVPACEHTVEAGTKTAIKSALGIPERCRSSEVEDIVTHPFAAIWLTDQQSLSSRSESDKPLLCYAPGLLRVSENYSLTGKRQTNPRNNSSTLVFEDAKPSEDSLRHYAFPKTQELELFFGCKPTLEAMQEKFAEIADQCSKGVTKIYGQPFLHQLVDLVYHSALCFTSPVSKNLLKGTLELGCIGPSGIGKSTLIENYLNICDLGTIVNCAQATIAGLLSSTQNLGGNWTTLWGTFPQNDEGIVFMDEVKALGNFNMLTAMRSSGKVSAAKASIAETLSRVRLIAVSNPRDGVDLDSTSFKCTTFNSVFQAPEAVRRFDFLYCPDIVAFEYPDSEECFPQELLRHSVLTAWTINEAEFNPEVLQLLRTERDRVFQMYESAQVPAVGPGHWEDKVLRVAVALACRFHHYRMNDSTGRPEAAQISPDHVRFAIEILEQCYSSIDLESYVATHRQEKIKEKEETKSRFNPEPIADLIQTAAAPDDFVKALYTHDLITEHLVELYTGWERVAILSFRRICLTQGACSLVNQDLVKTPDFVKWLKSYEPQKIPSHFEENF